MSPEPELKLAESGSASHARCSPRQRLRTSGLLSTYTLELGISSDAFIPVHSSMVSLMGKYFRYVRISGTMNTNIGDGDLLLPVPR